MSLSFTITILMGFLFSALFSGAETGSYMINRIRLRQREQAGRPSAVTLSKLLNKPLIFVFTVLIGNNIAVYLLSKAVTDRFLVSGMDPRGLFLGFIPWNAEIAATFTLTIPLFILAEIGPKNLFRKKADILMYRLAGFLSLLVWLCYPLTWSLKRLFQLMTHGMETGCEVHRLSSDGLKEYFSAGAKEGIISPDQNRMMDNATSMHDTPVRSLMIPLGKTPRLPSDAAVNDFKRLCKQRSTAYALLMDRHRVVGFVSLCSIVNRKLTDDQPVQICAENIPEIKEGRSLKSAFYRLRRNPYHSAVVVDARKHPVGIVKLEEIARHIVGN
ncbi:MAG: CNNM domain-containing protein [Kiritimatiellaceae bacterium]|nr:CNNM domain-containing protein [Kiritimatiellaceae bacterium]